MRGSVESSTNTDRQDRDRRDSNVGKKTFFEEKAEGPRDMLEVY